jgi:prephenate dehydrogenase
LLSPDAVFALNSAVQWKKVTLVGVGLLGGSLGIALRERRLAHAVVGFVRRAASIAECRQAGAVDEVTLDLAEAVSGADLVVLCTPLAQMPGLVTQMLPVLRRGAVVTDVGSVKAVVVRELEPLVARAGAHFVGSHPMAGSERTGVSSARGDLFHNAVCVVTSTPRTAPGARLKVKRLWRSVGGRVLELDAPAHDALVSRSSHLPHFVAAALAAHVLEPRATRELALLCAGGFRDTTRIASSSVEMWRDIALANRRNLSRELGALAKELLAVKAKLERGDAKGVERFLATARERRDAWAAQATAFSTE